MKIKTLQAEYFNENKQEWIFTPIKSLFKERNLWADDSNGNRYDTLTEAKQYILNQCKSGYYGEALESVRKIRTV